MRNAIEWNHLKPLKKPLFSKATMVMRFPAKKNAGCPKAPRDFPPRKDGILYPPPPSGCLGTPLPLPQSLCGRTDGRTDGYETITSQPKFLGSIGYQICLAMELRWRTLPAGSAMIYYIVIVGVLGKNLGRRKY